MWIKLTKGSGDVQRQPWPEGAYSVPVAGLKADAYAGVHAEDEPEDEYEGYNPEQEAQEFQYLTGLPRALASPAEIDSFERRFEREISSARGIPYTPESFVADIFGEESGFETLARDLLPARGEEEILTFNINTRGYEFMTGELLQAEQEGGVPLVEVVGGEGGSIRFGW